jgi:hypothetical protein
METGMSKLLQSAVVVLFGVFSALPSSAQQVALKSGFVVQIQKYHVAGNKLYYVGPDGKAVSVPLDQINMELTQQLNAAEKTPLKLPGMSATNETDRDDRAASLGEQAKRLRPEDSKATNQRVFTDDNFSHTATSDALPGASSTKNAETTFQDAEAAISKLGAWKRCSRGYPVSRKVSVGRKAIR